MIHLDANLIIGAGDATDMHHDTARLVLSGPGPFAASSVAWMEFVSRPMPSVQSDAARNLLRGGILPFDDATAGLAGELYYRTGSKRRTQLDSMIAATAMQAGAELATVNADDFAPFVPHGLKLFKW